MTAAAPTDRLTPKALLRAIDEPVRSLLQAVLGAADELELCVHLVGGPVRDQLLGKRPRDVDLVVEPSAGSGALELARAAAPEGARVVAHARFGTVNLRRGGAHLDLATVRSEHYASPGALPTIAAGTLEEDLRRRDFTVNALACPLSRAARRGRPAIIDPGSGRADLAARALRVFHERSFHDDPTRALRMARLAPRLGFRPSRVTRSALRAALRDGAFGGVSGGRFRAELVRLFDDARLGLDPARALGLLSEWHVLAALEPGLALHPDARGPLRRLGRLVVGPPFELPLGAAWVPGLMLWLAPLEAGLRRRVLRRLVVSGEPAARIRGFARTADAALRRLERSRGRGAADAILRSLEAEELAAVAAMAPANLRRRILRFADQDRHVELPVRGDDLAELGLEGPAIGRVLARIRTELLDGRVRSRAEALELATEMARRGRPGRG